MAENGPASGAERGRRASERAVLAAIRADGPLAKVELARRTGLTAQAAAQIVRGLERDGLLVGGARRRGRIGQPAQPFALDPDGAFFAGFHLGRRSSDLILMDFAGRVRARFRDTYDWPAPARVFAFAARSVARLEATAPAPERVLGLGVAAPDDLFRWADAFGAPEAALSAWRAVDLGAELAAIAPWPLHVCNDASAACAAELARAAAPRRRDFLYVFVGAFAGGGLVIDGALRLGAGGRAAMLGPLPLERKADAPLLLDRASTAALARRAAAAGLDAALVSRPDADWRPLEPALGAWIEDAGGAIAYLSVVAAALFEFEALVIDAATPRAVRARLVETVRRGRRALPTAGLPALAIEEGVVGPDARAIGGACLPLLAQFAPGGEALAARGATARAAFGRPVRR